MTFINEKVIEIIKCKHCDTKFEITDKDIEFFDKVSPAFLWKKYLIPSPTLCPDCRHQRRLSFRNEKKLYKRKCDYSWKEILSIYSPDKPYKVYDQEIWWSDKWDAMDYWIDFDFNKWFFEQFKEILNIIPNLAIYNLWSEWSKFTQLVHSKNCYLSFTWWFNEDVFYSTWTVRNNDVMDCDRCIDINNSYDCIYCINWLWLIWSENVINSSNCFFCYNLNNCTNCFMSSNHINKSYLFYDKQLSKSEYLEKLKYIDLSNKYSIYKKERQSMIMDSIHVSNTFINCENVLWDRLKNCNNLKNCFEISDSSYSSFCSDAVWNFTNCKDCNYWINWDLCYEVSTVWWYNYAFSLYSYPWISNSYYTMHCSDSSYLFWCIWLRNKSYCILNKQYTKEEYEEIVPKIIEHMKKTWEWWEFFPSSISPFWYNETVAMEYFPIEVPQSLTLSPHGRKGIDQLVAPSLPWGEIERGMGFNWSTYEAPFPKVEKVIKASMLPENIADIPDDILNWAIESELESTEGFSPLYRIIKQELEFYRKHNLPIPRRHPDQRHLDRMILRNPRKLYDRKCDKCGVDMKTTYSPERPEIVYCQTCYNKEVY